MAAGAQSRPTDDEPQRTPPSTLELLERAKSKGQWIGELCDRIHASKSEGGLGGILGVLSLAKKYGSEPIEEGCKVAIDVGVPSYRFVRRWIDRNKPEPMALRQIDPLIRELTKYRDIINQRMGLQEP